VYAGVCICVYVCVCVHVYVCTCAYLCLYETAETKTHLKQQQGIPCVPYSSLIMHWLHPLPKVARGHGYDKRERYVDEQ